MSNDYGSFSPRDMSARLAGVAGTGIALLVLVVASGWFIYTSCWLDVPPGEVAVLIKKTGLDLPPGKELAPDPSYKGVQIEVRKEVREILNPYTWEWQIFEQVEVPDGKVGVVIRLFGEDLPYRQLLASEEGQKGIVPGVLRNGRYSEYSNPYAYRVELHDAVTVPAGYKGVVTLLSGREPANPNELLVDEGERGVQRTVVDPGTNFVNPYEKRISLVDTRTKKLNLSDEKDMGFPSKDGFWIRLDGTIQFHVIPEKAAEVFVTYNEDHNGDDIEPEIVEKVILPNARAFCRLAGSSYTGKQFFESREEFQKTFETKMVAECEPKGIAIDSALISKVVPPEPIALPVRHREIAIRQRAQYLRDIEKAKSDANYAIEEMLVEQKRRVVEAEQLVIQQTTKANEEQKVAITQAEAKLKVAEERFAAATDQAAAILATGNADATVIRAKNEAEVSGLRAGVLAYGNNGFLYSQQVLFEKLAPSFRQIMANSSDSPIMQFFEQFQTASGYSGTRIGARTDSTSLDRKGEGQ